MDRKKLAATPRQVSFCRLYIDHTDEFLLLQKVPLTSNERGNISGNAKRKAPKKLHTGIHRFYSAAALLASCNAERCISQGNSVCLSVCHTLVPYPDE